MVPNANAHFFRIKAAQRDLIAAAGGIERAAEVAGFSKSQVGRWNHADSPDLMPVDAALRLEEETGRYDFTSAIAAARGRKLADTTLEAIEAGDIMARFSDVMRQVGDLSSAAAVAFADGKITPAEATNMIDKPTALLVQA
ncbi:phage regulatory CII family protein, partial [Nitratireductor sp. GCM10026969]|uniref:phage regulatory CII family protein n=1 Tax=Nitratireductor sp. GCM10026969 TaxID=3252645 RepID=UPI003621D520